MAKFFVWFMLLAISFQSLRAEAFDVRRHLSLVTRYDVGRDITNEGAGSSSIPSGCNVIHLNLLARHGTRTPTKKHIKEMDQLAARLEALLTDANYSSFHKIPSWLWGWKSPWRGQQKGGELLTEGEKELYLIGIRTRERFPDLFNEEYQPDVFSIRATQVPRASASAVAFGMGLLSERGTLGQGKNRAFSVISESRASDIWLRFFDTCTTYKELRQSVKSDVAKHKEPIFDEISAALIVRYHLNFTGQDISSLWFLCKQEASLQEIVDQACGLFSPSEIALLEWTDDLEAFLLRGYGHSLNYCSGVPLLRDIIQSMEQAIMAKEENRSSGTSEKARLRFAHAGTLMPFTCLLGLFIEDVEFDQIRREKPLSIPPKPPLERRWRGSVIAPFAGNSMLALYHCHANNSKVSGVDSKYFVQVLQNEVPVTMPGCDNVDLCPFEVFKEKIADPHLKHNYDILCNPKKESFTPFSITGKNWVRDT